MDAVDVRRLEQAAVGLALGLGEQSRPSGHAAASASPRSMPKHAKSEVEESRAARRRQRPRARDNGVQAAILDSVVAAVVSGPSSAWPLISTTLGMREMSLLAEQLPASVLAPADPVAQASSPPCPVDSHVHLNASDREWMFRDDEPWQDQFARAFGAAAGAAATFAHRHRPAMPSADSPGPKAEEAVARATSSVLASLLSDPEVILQVRDAVRQRLREEHFNPPNVGTAARTAVRIVPVGVHHDTAVRFSGGEGLDDPSESQATGEVHSALDLL